MKDKSKGIGLGVALLVALGVWLWSKRKPAEAAPPAIPPEIPPLGEMADPTSGIRHPEVDPATAYEQLGVEPVSQTELFEAVTSGQPIVSPVVDIEETTENSDAFEAAEDALMARLSALPAGTQCSGAHLDEKGNFYTCVNGYSVLEIRATEPPGELEAKKEEIRETGSVEREPESWMEKEILEQQRTGYTQVERNKLVYEYRQEHPEASGTEAYKDLFGTYLGR